MEAISLTNRMLLLTYRAMASAIDWVMFFLLYFISTFAIGAYTLGPNIARHHMHIPSEKTALAIEGQIILTGTVFTISMIAVILFSALTIYRTGKYGATLGQMFCGIRAYKQNGSPVSYYEAAIRFSPYIIILLINVLIMLIGNINYLYAIKGIPPFMNMEAWRIVDIFTVTWVVASALWALFDPLGRMPHDLPVSTVIRKDNLTSHNPAAM